jgi:DNA-binding transcriptional MocR family regulator
MPPGVTWTCPAGGFCCWVTLPDAPVFGDLYQAALRRGWAFAPGEVFLAQPGGQSGSPSCVRVCFGQQGPEAIRSGVEALARLVAARLEQHSALRLPAIEEWPPLV